MYYTFNIYVFFGDLEEMEHGKCVYVLSTPRRLPDVGD